MAHRTQCERSDPAMGCHLHFGQSRRSAVIYRRGGGKWRKRPRHFGHATCPDKTTGQRHVGL